MTFESSPRTRTKPKRSSTLRFSSEEISLTDSGAALSPGLAFATSPAELSSAKGEVSGMNILLLGSGGREHALAWKLAQSRLCDKLYAALERIVVDPAIVKRFEELGITAVKATPAEFVDLVTRQAEDWQPLIKAMDLK